MQENSYNNSFILELMEVIIIWPVCCDVVKEGTISLNFYETINKLGLLSLNKIDAIVVPPIFFPSAPSLF